MANFIIIDDLPLDQRRALIEADERKRDQIESLTKYKENEHYKYQLTVEGYSHVQSVKSDFKITYIYDLMYVGYDKNELLHRFELNEVSYSLDEYEDPVLVQIIEMSNKVSEIYQRLDFGVDQYGALKKIYNTDLIMSRWLKTKEYLTYKHPLTSFEIIKVKERELKNPSMAMSNISFMHFFQVYFKQFGRFDKKSIFDAQHMDQFGSGIPFMLRIGFDLQPNTEEGLMHRKMTGSMAHNANVIRELCKVTKQSQMTADYTTKADYYSDGMIPQEAFFSYNQKIGDGYDMYSFLHLKLIKDE